MRKPVKRLACQVDQALDIILPFAEYHRTPFWPYGRLIKNSSGYHGECLIQNKLALMYLGQTLDQTFKTMKQLREDMYVKLNKL